MRVKKAMLPTSRARWAARTPDSRLFGSIRVGAHRSTRGVSAQSAANCPHHPVAFALLASGYPRCRAGIATAHALLRSDGTQYEVIDMPQYAAAPTPFPPKRAHRPEPVEPPTAPPTAPPDPGEPDTVPGPTPDPIEPDPPMTPPIGDPPAQPTQTPQAGAHPSVPMRC
jgi:hypothetical protein